MIEPNGLTSTALETHFARGITIGILLSVAALPLPAFGQEKLENGQELAATFDLRHFGNAARINPDSARAQRVGLSDERLTAGLELLVARNLGRHTLNANATAAYDFYRRNSRLNRERLGLGIAAGLNVGPCLTDLSAEIARKQSDLETLQVLDDGSIESVKNTETTQSYGAELRCGRTHGLRPMVGYNHSSGNNTGRRAISNYRSDRLSAGLTYSHPVIGRLSVRYEDTKVSYPNREGTELALYDGFREKTVRGTMSRDIGTFLVADASVAYVSLQPNNGSADKFKGVTWRLAARAEVGPRLMLSVATQSAVSPSLQSASVYSRNRSHDVRATYAVSSRTAVSAGVYFSKRRHYGVVPIFGPVLEEDDFRRISATVTYKATPRLSFTLDGGNERRDGTGTFYDYSANYFGLHARFSI